MSDTSDNTTELRENTGAINNERNARSRLTGALDTLGSVVASVVRGAPQGLAPIVSSLPALKQFGQMMGFAEGYIDVWRDLTKGGINFGNEIDTMITSVGRANLRMEDFVKMVGENSTALAGIGGSMNAGATEFLRVQATFEALNGEFSDARENLNSLGMNSQMIAERFAEFDTIASIAGFRAGMSDRRRNLAATEFAIELDRLTKLTGIQAKQLAKETAEISRKGNVYGFGQQLTEDARLALSVGLEGVGQAGGQIVQDYITDMVTRGFPNPDDPNVRALHSLAPELRDAGLAIRDALRNGDHELARQLFRQAEIESGNLLRNKRLGDLAAMSSAAEITRSSQEILTQVANSTMAVGQQAARIRAQQDNPNATELTTEMLERARRDMAAEEEAARRAVGSRGEVLLNTQLEAVRYVQDAAASLQTTTVEGLVTLAESAVTSVRDAFKPIQGQTASAVAEWTTLVNTGLGTIASFAGGIADSSGAVGDQQRLVTSLQERLTLIAESLAAAGETTNAELVSRQARELQEAQNAFARNPQDADAARNLRLAMENAQNEIIANRDVIVMGTNITLGEIASNAMGALFDTVRERLGLPESSNATGTLGSTGRLFNNFGKETISALHGLEAVTTPEQMFDIVRNSALGAMQASSIAYEQSSSRNNSQLLNGMLNTIRTIPTQMSQMQNTTNDGQLQRTMTNLAVDLRNSFETAINSTLVPSVDQLVAISTQHADTSDKIRRGIGNMSSDMLRSV